LNKKIFSFYTRIAVSCYYKVFTEQKARSTYEYILTLTDDPDVIEPIKFLREREIVHFQRFGEANITKLSKKYSQST